MILALDLDDTLYPEQSFVFSGFRQVAKFISLNCAVPEETFGRDLIDEYYASGRGRIFDSVLKRHDIFSSALRNECVSKYQNHLPDILLFPGALDVINAYPSVHKYLVTDGNPLTQNNKVNALGIRNSFTEIFPTWSFGLEHAKPSLKVFEEILRREKSEFENLIYVGDDPNKDFVGLNKVGATTVRVLTGRFSNFLARPGFDAQFCISDISQFDLSRYRS